MIGKLILLLTFCVAIALPCHALEYGAVQADKSTLAFSFRQMNVPMAGKFGKFDVRLAFDPERTESAKVTLDVDLASIDTGSTEGDREVAGKAWFDTRAYPTAHFSSSSVKALGGNRYEVAGQLSLKGRTQTVVSPINLTISGETAVFDGAFVLKRADFGIGEGQWADFAVVANEIQISFHVLASASRKAP